MRPIDDSDQARFLRDWKGFIDGWTAKTVAARGGSRSEADDLRQAAYAEGYAGYLEWTQLPEDERTERASAAIVSRRVKDAVIEEWSRLRGVPRNAHQRGAGVRATILRESLRQISSEGQGARTRVETQSRALVAYHLLMEGLVHGQSGLVRPDTKLLRDEVRDRIHFALDRLRPPEARRLIEGFYFEGRSFKEVGEEIGIRSRSKLSRMHLAALRFLKDEMIEFASVLSARNAGHTLNDEPTAGDAPT